MESARILVVEDDAHLRAVLELLLAGKGRSVDSASNGRIALRNPRPDQP